MIAILLSLLTATPVPAGNLQEQPKGQEKELKVLARAPWRFGVQDNTQHQLVIRSQEELEKAAPKQADQLLKALKVDKIDWKTQMLVMVSAGAKRTGGYRVEITKLTPEGKTLTVHWKLHTPTGFVTQALTHPAESVLVERFDGPVKFDPPAAKAPEK
jgi:hypothetical protein